MRLTRSARRVRITRSSSRASRNGVPERIVRLGEATTSYAAVSGAAESAHLRVQVRLREIPRILTLHLRTTDWLGHARGAAPEIPWISAHLVRIFRLHFP